MSPTQPSITRTDSVDANGLRSPASGNSWDAAKKLGISPATLNRIELGTRPPSPEEVFGMAIVYGMPITQRERLLGMAHEASAPVWWDADKRTAKTNHMSALINFESEATGLISVETQLVPGLLQISDYTRAMLICYGKSSSEVEARVALRAGRQVVLTKPRPPEFLALIDEAVLRRCVGGPAIMARQIRHLIMMAHRHNVTIRIIPFAVGAHQGMVSSFKVITFAKAATIVFLEHLDYTAFLDKHGHVMPFVRAVQPICQAALLPGESEQFMAAIADEYESA